MTQKFDQQKIVGIVGIALLICGAMLLIVAASTKLEPTPNELGLHDKNSDGVVDYLDADVNDDTIVNFKDIAIISHAAGNVTESTPDGANWNPRLDLNEDDAIDEIDIGIVVWYNGYGIPLSFFGIAMPAALYDPTIQMFIAIVMIISAITLMYIGFVKK
jgi:hypothetical protein